MCPSMMMTKKDRRLSSSTIPLMGRSMVLAAVALVVAVIASFAPIKPFVHGLLTSSPITSKAMTTTYISNEDYSMDHMTFTFRSSPYHHHHTTTRTAVKASSSMNDGFVDDDHHQERGESDGGDGGGGSRGGSGRSSRDIGRRSRTLYDVLGASPKDSAAQLRERYKNLAREFHPDAVARREIQMNKLFYLKKNNNNNNNNNGDDDPTASNSESDDTNEESNTNQYDIAEINAAYQVLSNPKERLRYDRQLQANEFKAGFESMVQRGFDNAIPFIKKTANTTQSVVEQSVESSSRVFQEIAKSAPNVVSNVVGGTVLSTFSNNNNNNQRNNIQQDPATLLERRAEMELSKAANLKEQIANLPNTRHQLLQKDTAAATTTTTTTTTTYNTNDDGKRIVSRKQLSSTDALNIMKNLSRAPDGSVGTGGVDALPSLVKDITTLSETERVFETTTKQYQTLEREVTMADRKVQQTTRAKEIAQQNLLDAQKALAEAQSNMDIATKQHVATTQQIKKTYVELDKSRRSMETMREKVRMGLYSHETKSIELRTKLLRKESMDLEISAKKLLNEANRERSKQKKLERQQQQQQQQQQKGKTG